MGLSNSSASHAQQQTNSNQCFANPAPIFSQARSDRDEQPEVPSDFSCPPDEQPRARQQQQVVTSTESPEQKPEIVSAVIMEYEEISASASKDVFGMVNPAFFKL